MNKRQRGLGRFSATVLSVLATIAVVEAQPAAQAQDSPSPKTPQQIRAAVLAVAKPQVVYSIRSREAAEALHAQSKAIGDDSLPIDASMPISLQISRANANAAAAAARNAEAGPAETPGISRSRKHKAQNVRRSAPRTQAKPFGSPGKGAHFDQ